MTNQATPDWRADRWPDCIDWTGSIDRHGYGRTNNKLVHRVAYSKAKGEIPEGLTIDHLCRNRRCINPKHLEAVSRIENTMRGRGFGAVNAAKTHCPKGHPFDEANTYLSPYRGNEENGAKARQCRACNRMAAAAYRTRKRTP